MENKTYPLRNVWTDILVNNEKNTKIFMYTVHLKKLLVPQDIICKLVLINKIIRKKHRLFQLNFYLHVFIVLCILPFCIIAFLSQYSEYFLYPY